LSILPETAQPFSTDIILEPVDNQRLANLCGPMDEHLRQLERRLGVEINNRGNTFRVIGDAPSVELAERVIKELYAATDHEILSPERVHLFLKDSGIDEEDQLQIDQDVFIKTKRGVIKGRSPNQKLYLKNILSHDICFGVGPAGTGKTYLAVACAIAALEHDHARRLVLVRPAVEAGEKLGFLPGDLVQKVDPYLRPLYDALYEMLGFERVAKYMERNVIEVAPLAFMRGRTLNESFVILDEAQNTTIEQMKMFLTRIGFNSTAVVTGDITQTDLPRDKKSGLRNVIDILKDEEGISFTFFKSRDVVRHPLVARILNAYERYENIKENPRERSGADNEDKG
jgi:phosphate starvation-inducible PhoH-like protein